MNKVVAHGQTVEDAVLEALKQLNVPKEQVQVRVLEEPKRGWLGIFGARMAKVEVERLCDPAEEAFAFLSKVLPLINPDATVEKQPETGKRQVVFEIKGENLGRLIGKRGQTLEALQFLTNLVANQASGRRMQVILDADGYRQQRAEVVAQLAEKLARKVMETGQKISLDPMPAMERKIIHQVVQAYPQITSYSVGIEPQRYVVISLKS